MPTGAITGYIDVAQITLYVFWIFFAGLIYYLRREDKREGYPLESDRSDKVRVQGFPPIPEPKEFILAHGAGIATAPRDEVDTREIRARPVAPWPGAPLEPTGNPMVDGVGPAAYANRADKPDLATDGQLKIVPLREDSTLFVASRDPDPRGMEVIGADRRVAGRISDVWVDRPDMMVRYLEVEIPAGSGEGAQGPRRVLLPINFANIDARRGRVRVKAILAAQFADVPGLENPNQVTFREEDRISAYYAGGLLYAEPSRVEPLL